MTSPVRLSELAYYRTGGPAREIFQPTSLEELQKAMRAIKQQGMPYFFLGGGTNSLVTDEHWPGAVVAFGKLLKLELSEDLRLTVGAGVENSAAARFAYAHGLAGIAWMNGLPGQLGGTARMNARCYGGEIGEVVEQVTTVDANGDVHVYRDASVFRGYKDTVFMENNQAIAEVVIRLTAGEPAAIKAKMDFCRQDRENKGQYVHPSCGCVFKNDYSVGVPSGMLLERAGMKGLKYQGAEVNPHHANFLYNVHANSRAIIEATLMMRDKVFSEFGVWLAYEMEILGNLPADLADKVREQREHQFKLDKLKPLRKEFAARS